MIKIFSTSLFLLFLNGCTPDPKNFIGMDSSWIKPLIVLFLISGAIVLIFLGITHQIHKKKYSFGFFEGLAFLIGPGLFTAICYIILAVSGFLIISFYSNIILIIVFLVGASAFLVEYLDNKKNK